MGNVVGTRTVSTIPANIRILNYDISELFNPELSKGKEIQGRFLKLYSSLKKSAPVDDVKYKILDDTDNKKQIAIAGIAGGATATYFTVAAADSKLVRPNTMIYNASTGERMLVNAVNYGSGRIDVTRDYGTVLGGAANNAVGHNLFIGIGADSENASAPESITNDPMDSYNYISNIRTAWDISTHEKNTRHEVIKDPKSHFKAKARRDHLFKMEETVWFSARGTGTDANGNTYTTTGGILQHIKRVEDISGGSYGGVLTERLMDYLMELAFINGSTVKEAFCGVHFLTALSGFAKNRLILNDQQTKKLGMAISEYTHGGNTLRLVAHPAIFSGTGATTAITGGTMASKLVILDSEHIDLVYMRNMDTEMIEHTAVNGKWGEKGEWRTTLGVRMRPGLDNTYNAASGVPDQYQSPHLIVDGFDTY